MEVGSQKQRWVKYGSNVLLSCVVVIALAGVATYLAQANPLRLDTTLGGTQSLRPQTIQFIHDLKADVKIIALYPKLRSEGRQQEDYQPVVDLLNEYASNSPHISAETIDPDTQKDRFNKLVEEVTNRYGGEVKGYKAVLAGLKDQDAAVSKFATAEAELYKALPIDAIQDEELHQTALAGFLTVVSIPSQIKDMEEAIDGYTSQQIPSYKDAVDQARATYTNIGQLLDVFSHNAMSLAVTKGIPKEFLAYAGPATKRVAEAQKIVEGVLAQVGQLKDITQINEFRDQLRTKSILVMTNDGYRILSYDQVWRMPQSTPYVLAPTASQARMTFAGEQQITMAIAALTGGPRRLVVFTHRGPIHW